ncbi:MAG: hypothetical protein AB7Q01_14640 [Gammaproteobacteria bacterium]
MSELTALRLAEILHECTHLRAKGDELNHSAIELVIRQVMSDKAHAYWQPNDPSHTNVVALISDLRGLSMEAQGVVDHRGDPAYVQE